MIVMVPICVFAHPLFCYRSCFYCDLHSFPTRRSSDLGTPALIGRHDASVLEIALDHGFASAATFARAFRTHFGMSATRWRAGGAARWRARLRRKPSKQLRNDGKARARSRAHRGRKEAVMSIRVQQQPPTTSPTC